MHAPIAVELLDAWERGLSQPTIQRALTLLAAACPEERDEDLWSLSIGQRDARLFELRRRLFGSELDFVGACPACGERLESSVQVADVCRAGHVAANETHELDVDTCRVRFRLPTCLDVATVLAGAERCSPRAALLERCVEDARTAAGERVEVGALPASTAEALGRRMAELDPQADVEFDLVCPACGSAFTTPFDIASFLWKEVNAWARRTLREVHSLARAYGWSELETLALSPMRRSLYLELSSRALAEGYRG